MNVYIDIETIPCQTMKPEDFKDKVKVPANYKKPETIEQYRTDNAEDAWRKTSFDGAYGQICTIAFAVNDGDIISFNDDNGEKQLLENAFSLINELVKGQTIFFIGHYIGGFDLKFLFHRAVISQVDPKINLPFNGRHGSQFFDNMYAWAGFGNRISQDDLCKALSIEGKPSNIDGSKVWDYYKEGRIDEIEEYNRDDVDKARQIYKRLNFRG